MDSWSANTEVQNIEQNAYSVLRMTSDNRVIGVSWVQLNSFMIVRSVAAGHRWSEPSKNNKQKISRFHRVRAPWSRFCEFLQFQKFRYSSWFWFIQVLTSMDGKRIKFSVDLAKKIDSRQKKVRISPTFSVDSTETEGKKIKKITQKAKKSQKKPQNENMLAVVLFWRHLTASRVLIRNPFKNWKTFLPFSEKLNSGWKHIPLIRIFGQWRRFLLKFILKFEFYIISFSGFHWNWISKLLNSEFYIHFQWNPLKVSIKKSKESPQSTNNWLFSDFDDCSLDFFFDFFRISYSVSVDATETEY